MFKSLLLTVFSAGAFAVFAADAVAVFPVIGVNTDKSFIQAFGATVALKYSQISGTRVIAPIKSAKAIGSDSSLSAAAKSLGVSEYIELDAVGLFLSNRERNELYQDSSGQKIIVVVQNKDENDEKSDQQLLDNSKTIVTATRYNSQGNEIHRVELTLLTYGDIEEASQRIATALFKKISIEEARTLTTITRREGMGNNSLFVNKVKGVKAGGQGVAVNDGTIAPFVNIGFDMRLEADKYFLEFGVGGRIPSSSFTSDKRYYGGVYFELAGNYYLTPGPIGFYAGGGVIPFINLLSSDGLQMGIAPCIQGGVMLPRDSRVRFYVELRVAQNVMPIKTRLYSYDYITYYSNNREYTSYPTEIGLNVGIGF